MLPLPDRLLDDVEELPPFFCFFFFFFFFIFLFLDSLSFFRPFVSALGSRATAPEAASVCMAFKPASPPDAVGLTTPPSGRLSRNWHRHRQVPPRVSVRLLLDSPDGLLMLTAYYCP